MTSPEESERLDRERYLAEHTEELLAFLQAELARLRHRRRVTTAVVSGVAGLSACILIVVVLSGRTTVGEDASATGQEDPAKVVALDGTRLTDSVGHHSSQSGADRVDLIVARFADLALLIDEYREARSRCDARRLVDLRGRAADLILDLPLNDVLSARLVPEWQLVQIVRFLGIEKVDGFDRLVETIRNCPLASKNLLDAVAEFDG